MTPTVVILLETTPCCLCGFRLRPRQTLDDHDPGDSFYRGANGHGPYCLACWNKPRDPLPTFGARNAMIVSSLLPPRP